MSDFSRGKRNISRSFIQGPNRIFLSMCFIWPNIDLKVRKNILVTNSLKSFHNLLDLSQKGYLTFLNVIKFQLKPPHFITNRILLTSKPHSPEAQGILISSCREGRYEMLAISQLRHLFSLLIFWISLISCSLSSKAACIFPSSALFMRNFPTLASSK